MSRPHFSANSVAQAEVEKTPVQPEQSGYETEPDNSATELPKTSAAQILNDTTHEPTTEIEQDGLFESISAVIDDVRDHSAMQIDDDAADFEITEDDLIVEESPQPASIPEAAHQETSETQSEPEAEIAVPQLVDSKTGTDTRQPTAKATLEHTSDEVEFTSRQPKYVSLPVALAARAAQTDAAEVDTTAESKTAASTPNNSTESDTPTSRPRANQRRTSQPRPTRERKHSADAEQQGSKPVSRKFRVDTPGGEPQEAPEEVKANVAGTKIQSNSPQGGRRHRIDDGVPLGETLRTGDSRVRTKNRPRRRYIDEAHEDAIRGPHFQVTAPKRTNLTSMTGHVLAYLGVLGLTIGTAIVICGHFLGYSDYTPTGWLVTTVAQMMLFLGVINLVSGGIDQTNEDVSNRINTLGEQLLRIEQVTEEALRGPKISARRYMGEDAEVEERERETAGRTQ